MLLMSKNMVTHFYFLATGNLHLKDDSQNNNTPSKEYLPRCFPTNHLFIFYRMYAYVVCVCQFAVENNGSTFKYIFVIWQHITSIFPTDR